MAGDSYELGTVVSQAATPTRQAVELQLRDIVAEGTVTVPVGGITCSNNIELSGPVAQITGAAPLTLSGQLSGNGTLAVPLTLPAGGSVLVSSGNELAFTEPVTNAAGASISDIGGMLAFPGSGSGSDGLLNRGTLNLTNLAGPLTDCSRFPPIHLMRAAILCSPTRLTQTSPSGFIAWLNPES